MTTAHLRLLAFALAATLPAAAQLNTSAAHAPTAPPAPGKITLDVVVTEKNGPPVANLTAQDFTLLDNKIPQPITSFKSFSGPQAPVQVVLLVDAVNATYSTVAYERTEIDKYLHAEGGHLAHPTALAVLGDTNTQLQDGFSTDGNALSADLDKYTVALRTVTRSQGIYGAEDRLTLSLNALRALAQRERTIPGHKVVFWISPGWPLLSGPGIQLTNHQQQGIFENVVALSAELRQSRITLYSIDPLGTNESILRATYYESFLKGVSKPSQSDIADLSLQVLATQSGGLALRASNDIAALLQKASSDTQAWYEVTFSAAPAEKPNEYHSLEIKLAQPGLTARTRSSYYSQP